MIGGPYLNKLLYFERSQPKLKFKHRWNHKAYNKFQNYKSHFSHTKLNGLVWLVSVELNSISYLSVSFKTNRNTKTFYNRSVAHKRYRQLSGFLQVKSQKSHVKRIINNWSSQIALFQNHRFRDNFSRLSAIRFSQRDTQTWKVDFYRGRIYFT